MIVFYLPECMPQVTTWHQGMSSGKRNRLPLKKHTKKTWNKEVNEPPKRLPKIMCKERRDVGTLWQTNFEVFRALCLGSGLSSKIFKKHSVVQLNC